MSIQLLPPWQSLRPIISFSITPNQTRVVTYNSVKYYEYMITKSCDMTVPLPLTGGFIWLLGGGGGGAAGAKATGGGGGAGGSTKLYNGPIYSGTIYIGAGGAGGAVGAIAGTDGGTTAVGMPPVSSSYTTTPGGGAGYSGYGGTSGGSGGGAGRASASSGGYGIPSSYYAPFGDTANWAQFYGAGGGGASHYETTDSYRYKGGAGGSKGASGSDGVKTTSTTITGGAGGATGGGAGGTGSSTAGSVTAGGNATGWGGGGGGGGSRYISASDYTYKNGGAGYQGLIIIRIPYNG